MNTYTIKYYGTIFQGNNMTSGYKGKMSGLSAENVQKQIVNYRERYKSGKDYDTRHLVITLDDSDLPPWVIEIHSSKGVFNPV